MFPRCSLCLSYEKVKSWASAPFSPVLSIISHSRSASRARTRKHLVKYAHLDPAVIAPFHRAIVPQPRRQVAPASARTAIHNNASRKSRSSVRGPRRPLVPLGTKALMLLMLLATCNQHASANHERPSATVQHAELLRIGKSGFCPLSQIHVPTYDHDLDERDDRQQFQCVRHC